MQRQLYHRFPLSCPPMHAWPRAVKLAVMGLAALICLGAYVILFGGLLSLMSILISAG